MRRTTFVSHCDGRASLLSKSGSEGNEELDLDRELETGRADAKCGHFMDLLRLSQPRRRRRAPARAVATSAYSYEHHVP